MLGLAAAFSLGPMGYTLNEQYATGVFYLSTASPTCYRWYQILKRGSSLAREMSYLKGVAVICPYKREEKCFD